MKLVASRPLTYATRRLLPGDPFVADDRVARVLIAAKKARKDTGDALQPSSTKPKSKRRKG